MKLGQFAVFTLIGLSAVACGKGSSKSGTTETTSADMPKGGSCTEEKTGVCTEYSDNPLGIAESACKSMFKGTYAKSGCSTTNLIGSCQRKSESTGKPGDKEFYYYGNGVAPWLEDAKKDCENNPLFPGGKFTAQPDAEAKSKEKGIPEASHFSGSCVKSDNSCEDNFGRLGGDGDKQICEDLGGKYSDKACDQTNLVGSCLKTGKVSRYFSANLKGSSMKNLQSDCENGFMTGHWYPSPNAPADAKPADAKPASKGAAKTGGAAPAKPKKAK